jgi:hypothetical protein
MSTVQRNALVAPFSVNSPLLEGGSSNDMRIVGGGKDKKPSPPSPPSGPVAITHQKWFTQVQQAINSTAQVTATIPANSAAKGQPGTFAFDSNWLYVCVGVNEWRRAALNVF